MASRLIIVDNEKRDSSSFSSGDEKDIIKSNVDSVHELEKVPPLGVPVDTSNQGGFNAIFTYFRREKQDLDAIATQPSVFDHPTTLEKFRPPPQFENAHRFDILARWTWREEKV